MPAEIMLNPQDLLDAITAQRNASLDEIARQAGIIRALSRRIEELENPQPAPTEAPANG